MKVQTLQQQTRENKPIKCKRERCSNDCYIYTKPKKPNRTPKIILCNEKTQNTEWNIKRKTLNAEVKMVKQNV